MTDIPKLRTQRHALLGQGEPAIWMSGGMAALAILMIALLLGWIAWAGLSTFWPLPVHQVEYTDNDKVNILYGEPTRYSTFKDEALGREVHRTLYRSGNNEITGTHFVWVRDDQIKTISKPEWVFMIERTGWGNGYATLDELVFEGERFIGPAAAWAKFPEVHAKMLAIAAEKKAIEKHDMGGIGHEKNEIRVVIDAAEARHGVNSPEYKAVQSRYAQRLAELDAALLPLTDKVRQLETRLQTARVVFRTPDGIILPEDRALVPDGSKQTHLEFVASHDGHVSFEGFVEGDSFQWVNDQGQRRMMTKPLLAVRAPGEPPAQRPSPRIVLKPDDGSPSIKTSLPVYANVLVTEGHVKKGQVLAARPIAMLATQVVRTYPANQLGWWGKCGIYFSRWGEYIFDEPREANMAGGIWPALIGTVLMTMIMVICVVPVGVVGAIYLREYARQGFLVSLVRITVNNLAGVPSIVFGVFGLGFFVYLMGGSLDRIFFSDRLPKATIGTTAMLWASATLALLTLPVVIVATEEALAAVPRSLREASYGCGATKWQTIWRVVLPRALPGVMTGGILAIARGAGEVAPLMLVGVIKFAPELPISSEPPFFGANRAFMHLGFHIYDLGFQSQNSEAAKNMVYTTTLLLISLVVVLNLCAMWIRNRLRRGYQDGHF